MRRAEVCGRAPPGDYPLPRKPVPDLTSHRSGRCHPDQNAGCSRQRHLFWCRPGHLLGEGQTDRGSAGPGPQEGKPEASKSKAQDAISAGDYGAKYCEDTLPALS